MAKFSSTFILGFLLLFLFINVKVNTALEYDGSLIVPKDWINGKPISVICQINNLALLKCTNSGRGLTATVFKKDGSTFCSVRSSFEQQCLDAKPYHYSSYYADYSYYPDTCWCEKDSSGFVNYVYRFWADPRYHNGTWTCEKECKNETALSSVDLNINLNDGVNKIVTYTLKKPAQACDRSSNRTVLILPERKEAVYIDCKQPLPDKPDKEVTEHPKKQCPICSEGLSVSSAALIGTVGAAVGAILATLVSALLGKKMVTSGTQRRNSAIPEVQSTSAGHHKTHYSSMRKYQMDPQMTVYSTDAHGAITTDNEMSASTSSVAS